MPNFTFDWTMGIHEAMPLIGELMPSATTVLEVGSFEGRSTLIWAEKWPNAIIDCVDTWKGSDERDHRAIDFEQVFARFRANIDKHRVRFYRAESKKVLPVLAAAYFYDFAYIDGSHVATDVCLDGLLVAPMIRPGGLILFDDYGWKGDPERLRRPKPGIDAFLSLVQGWTVRHVGYSVLAQRNL